MPARPTYTMTQADGPGAARLVVEREGFELTCTVDEGAGPRTAFQVHLGELLEGLGLGAEECGLALLRGPARRA